MTKPAVHPPPHHYKKRPVPAAADTVTINDLRWFTIISTLTLVHNTYLFRGDFVYFTDKPIVMTWFLVFGDSFWVITRISLSSLIEGGLDYVHILSNPSKHQYASLIRRSLSSNYLFECGQIGLFWWCHKIVHGLWCRSNTKGMHFQNAWHWLEDFNSNWVGASLHPAYQ